MNQPSYAHCYSHRAVPWPCSGFQPNFFDACLHEEMAGHEWNNTGGPGYQLSPMMMPIDWQNPPPGVRTYREVASILRPAVEGVATTVVTFRVPPGYDGVLLTITAIWVDPPVADTYTNGSGDIVWRVRGNNRWYFKDLGNILTERGDLSTPYALEGGGYPICENQTITMETQLGVGALGRLDPDGRIICGLSGWFYPRGRKRR